MPVSRRSARHAPDGQATSVKQGTESSQKTGTGVSTPRAYDDPVPVEVERVPALVSRLCTKLCGKKVLRGHSQRVAKVKPTAMKPIPTIRFFWPRSSKIGSTEVSLAIA